MKISAAIVGALLSAAPSIAPAETLLDAIQIAYETNPELRAQRADLQATNEGYVQARAGYGPQISVTGGYQYEYAGVQLPSGLSNSTTTANYSVATGSADLSLVQPLYTAGRNKSHVAEASDSVLAARQDLRAAEASLILNVVTAYMDVLRDREMAREIQSEVDELTAFQQEIGSRGRLGEMSKTDVAQADSRLLAARAQLVQAQGRLGLSSSEYLATVGQNPGELQPPSVLPGVPNNVEDAFNTAAQNNADLMAAIQKERAARDHVNAAKAENGPTVSLKVDAGIQPDAAYIPNQYDRSVTAQVVVTQPIYTSGLNSSRIREAVDRDTNAQLLIESTRRDVVRRVSQAWDQFTASQNALAVVTQQLDAEEVAAKGMRLEERAGARTTIDLLNADAELTNARLTEIQDRHDVLIARAALLAAMGMLEAKYLTPSAPQDDPAAAFKGVEGRTAPVWEDGIGILLDQIGSPSTPPPKVSTGTAGGARPNPADHPVAQEGAPVEMQHDTVRPEPAAPSAPVNSSPPTQQNAPQAQSPSGDILGNLLDRSVKPAETGTP
jgi:TolC family type I secretion outer membrane protein